MRCYQPTCAAATCWPSPPPAAYHHSMASTYNETPRPPVVAVADGCSWPLVRRETVGDLLRRDLGWSEPAPHDHPHDAIVAASRPPSALHDHRAGAAVFDEYLCLQYEIAPVPASLLGDTHLHEGGDGGVAVDGHRTCFTGAAAPTGSRATGLASSERCSSVRGPGPPWGTSECCSPFAHTAGLSRLLCEVPLSLEDHTVRRTSIDRA